ncbi:MAG: hypothetical protein GTO02_04215, partial [Candidatus Dadabacteria bacterium]|nr:hypothetical protein [Candidatus Dadabacteria bacterium]
MFLIEEALKRKWLFSITCLSSHTKLFLSEGKYARTLVTKIIIERARDFLPVDILLDVVA